MEMTDMAQNILKKENSRAISLSRNQNEGCALRAGPPGSARAEQVQCVCKWVCMCVFQLGAQSA